MERNYLITNKDLLKFLNLWGFESFKRSFILEGRRSGKTTAIALASIARAIKNPGKSVNIVDHFGNISSNVLLLNTIKTILVKLNLKGFEININNNTLTFHLYETNPEDFLKSIKVKNED